MSFLSGRTSLTTVQTGDLAADSVTSAKIADDAIDSEHYTDGSVDLAHMAANSIDSDQYVDGSVDLAHMSSQAVDEDNLHISNTGSNGEFLSKQSGDAGGLTWAAAGGGLTSITNTALSDTANIDFTGFASGTYDNYMVIISNGRPGTDNTLLEMETSTDGGSSYDVGGGHYRWAVSQCYMSGTPQDAGSAGDTEIQLTGAQGQGSAANEHTSFKIQVYLAESSEWQTFTWEGIMTNVNGDRLLTTGAAWSATLDVDALRFHWSSGNWAAVGKIQFLGIAH